MLLLEPISKITPRRDLSQVGRKPKNYPDLDFQQLASILHITPTFLGRIMNGVSRPSLDVAGRLAVLLGWSIDAVSALYKPPAAKNSTKAEKVAPAPRNRRESAK